MNEQTPVSSQHVPTAEQLDSAAANYASELVELLSTQLNKVIEIRKPDILPYIVGDKVLTEASNVEVLSVLEAWGIWFQLLNIAEENTGMPKP